MKRRMYQSIGRRLCRVPEDLAGLLKADSRDLEKNTYSCRTRVGVIWSVACCVSLGHCNFFFVSGSV